MSRELDIVYFSSVTNNTHRFVEKLNVNMKKLRIPLTVKDSFLHVDNDYILFCPSYGGGNNNKAVPKQVIKFLNNEKNREHCVGLIISGNTNFFEDYGIAGKVLQNKLKVPCLYTYELMGTEHDVKTVENGIKEFKRTTYKNI